MREFHTATRRLDEVVEPVEYAIARDAESFHQVQDTPLRIAVGDPFPGVIPRLRAGKSGRCRRPAAAWSWCSSGWMLMVRP